MRILCMILFTLIPSVAMANRVLVHIPTDTVLESASSATDAGLMSNGVGMGYPSGELKVVEMTEAEAIDKIKNHEWGNDLTTAKARRIKEIRIEARKILSENTDWYIVRKSENNTAIPATITAYRASVRQVVQDSVTAINATTTIDAVRDYKPVWPMAPGE